ncbi:MAG TPA: glycoside hydrolase family 9 protein, partial [Prolixibacteraceae bacterium]|nr:glycoside hydrolase family 9 protein [Prolixibacteraceae bacterium]
MKKSILPLIILTFFTFLDIYATKLVELKTVDNQYLLVIFRDGEVFYRDDATGPSAYKGHKFVEGDDTLKVYGNELNTVLAGKTNSWTIFSEDDRNYQNGVAPVAVHRKSKILNTDAKFNYKLDHWMFLKVPHTLKDGATYTLKISPETETDLNEKVITFDITQNISEAVHVNINGYMPESPVKSADLYLWMGDGGQRDYKSYEGNSVWLYDIETGEKHRAGKVTFWKSDDTKAEAEGRNLTGSDVWNADFSKFSKPGKYRLVIEDVGCSMDFEIKNDVYFEPYKTSVRGYYYMRVGEDRLDMVPVPRQPTFIPEKDPEGFTIYLTDLDPFDKIWNEIPGDTWDEPHFKPGVESIFWKHRLPGNPTNPNAVGGHSDAFDWDRHLAHVSNIYDLLLPYFLTNGRINEDNLNIGESGNGIPDVIDEARNEVDLFLNLRDGDAYCQGLTNPSKEHTIMFQAGPTTMAAWANAANCAMLAESFRISGHNDLMEYYTKEAIKAFVFAGKQDNLQLDDRQDVGDCNMRGRDFKQMAAAFLYNITGEAKWEDILAEESVVQNANSQIDNKRKWYQIWGTAAYLNTPQKRNYPELYENMKSSVQNQALEHNVKHMELRPSRRSSNNNYWQTPHNMQLVMLAHFVSDDEKKQDLFKKSMFLEADWGLGRNPTNTVEMTGLGERNIENCYTTGRNDGTPGLHPGHTPYNNLDPWGKVHKGGNPQWFVEQCYPEWISGGWPHQEGFFNCRYVWANG